MYYDFGYSYWLTTGLFLGTMIVPLMATAGNVLYVPLERPLVLREFRNGAYCVEAYWAARATLAVLSAAAVAFVQARAARKASRSFRPEGRSRPAARAEKIAQKQ